MKEIETKTILSTTKDQQWFGNDYNMNLFRGCCHGCIYCDSRSDCYRIENFDCVRAKKNALFILNNELKRRRKKGVIGIGAMSDSYNPWEHELELTRGALQLIHHYGFGISLETKSPLVVRDIDLFQSIQQKNNVIIKLTITCSKDALSKKIEPHVAPSSERFKAIKRLSEAGIFCGVLMTPILPFITDSDENMMEVIRMSYEAGAKFVFSMYGVTLRDNQREYYYTQLDRLFPGLSFQYRQHYRNAYFCSMNDFHRKKRLFEQTCQHFGLLYRMEDIIQAYKKSEAIKQLSLF